MQDTNGKIRAITRAIGIGVLTLAVLATLPLLVGLAWFARLALVIAVPGVLVAVIASARVRRRFRLTDDDARDTYRGFTMPDGLIMHPAHAWTRIDGNNAATIGADDLMQRAIGPVDVVALPAPGTRFSQGDPLFALRSGARRVAVRAPVDGSVVRVNQALVRHPGEVNRRPYDAGWVVKVRPRNEGGGNELRRGQRARSWFCDEVDRLLRVTSPEPALARTAQDGGVVVDDLYRTFDEQTWQAVREEFFGADRDDR